MRPWLAAVTWRPEPEPRGIASDCFWTLAMHGGQDTVAGLHANIAAENAAMGWPVPSPAQVLHALHGLARRARPLVVQDGRGPGSRWLVTDHGHDMAGAWAGPDDDPPGRVPCGLGWPP